MRHANRLILAMALAAALPRIALAEHPLGSPAWLREQQASQGVPAAAPPSESTAQAPEPDGGATVETTESEPSAAPVAAAPEPVTTPVEPGGEINPLSKMALGDLQAFKGRPLFAPSRRGPEQPAPAPILAETAPVSETQTPAPDLRLIGIVAGVDKAVAVIGNQSGGPPISVRVGDAVETWRVDLIAPDRVVLRQGERTRTYRLFASAGAAVRTPAQMRKNEASAESAQRTSQPELDR